MGTVLEGVLIIGGSLLLALLGMWLTRRLLPHHVLAPHNDVAGFVYAITGLAYAVVLAFVVIAVWEQFEAAQQNADREANALTHLYLLAGTFPDAEEAQARTLLLDYSRSVVDDDWPAMADGDAPAASSEQRFDDLWGFYQSVSGVLDPTAYDRSLEGLIELGEARQQRLVDSERGLPRVMWTVLIIGGVLTVGFAYFFGVENPRSHALLIGILTLSLALLLFLVTVLDNPYRGATRVDPDGFEQVLRLIERESALLLSMP